MFSLKRLVVASSLVASVARAAPDPQACVVAVNEAGALRSKGQLLAAREKAITCGDPACPSVVRSECLKIAEQLADEVPTIVVSATDGANDLVEVSVAVDGVIVRTKLDGTPIALDPGAHALVFASKGGKREQTLVLKVGEKRRAVTVVFAAEAPKKVEPARAVETPRPLWPLWLAGAGLVSAGAGVLLQLRTSAEIRDLRESCAPACDEGDVSRLRRQYWFAGGLYGLSAIALGAAAYAWFATEKTKVSVSPMVGGGGVTMEVRF